MVEVVVERLTGGRGGGGKGWLPMEAVGRSPVEGGCEEGGR